MSCGEPTSCCGCAFLIAAPLIAARAAPARRRGKPVVRGREQRASLPRAGGRAGLASHQPPWRTGRLTGVVRLRRHDPRHGPDIPPPPSRPDHHGRRHRGRRERRWVDGLPARTRRTGPGEGSPRPDRPHPVVPWPRDELCIPDGTPREGAMGETYESGFSVSFPLATTGDPRALVTYRMRLPPRRRAAADTETARMPDGLELTTWEESRGALSARSGRSCARITSSARNRRNSSARSSSRRRTSHGCTAASPRAGIRRSTPGRSRDGNGGPAQPHGPGPEPDKA